MTRTPLEFGRKQSPCRSDVPSCFVAAIVLFCLEFVSLRHLPRLIFLLILPRTLPAQINNKRDEAQQPPSTPNKLLCGAHLLRRQTGRGIRKQGLISLGFSAPLGVNHNPFVDNNQIVEGRRAAKVGAGSRPREPGPDLDHHPPMRTPEVGVRISTIDYGVHWARK